MKRKNWMGVNGSMGNTLFVDGMLEGQWRIEDGKITVQTYRDLTKREQAELDDEITRTEAFLAR